VLIFQVSKYYRKNRKSQNNCKRTVIISHQKISGGAKYLSSFLKFEVKKSAEEAKA